MFNIEMNQDGGIKISGRFDAAQVEKAKEVFNRVVVSCNVDFKDLEYISSAGLGVLLMTQKRLSDAGNALKLVNMSKHVKDIFQYAGFDTIFEIESP
jgi:anti-sigma B factor antagonist